MSNWRDWVPENLDDLDEWVDEEPETFEPIQKRNNKKEVPEPKKIKPRYESEKE